MVRSFFSLILMILPPMSNKLFFYLFVDDTNIYFESNNLNHLQSLVNKELNQARKWLDSNKQVINIDRYSAHKTLNETLSIKIVKPPVKQTK